MRDYPCAGALAAHVVGYTGPVTEEGLKTVGEGREGGAGRRHGRVELQYDRAVRPAGGRTRQAQGGFRQRRRQRCARGERDAAKGSDVHLAIKGPVQYVADELAALIAPENGIYRHGQRRGGLGVVVMDLRDEHRGHGESPPARPGRIHRRRVERRVRRVQFQRSSEALLNRAISGTYPAASTYKTFTGLAALANGFADMKRTWTCNGSWTAGARVRGADVLEHSGHGTLDLRGGIDGVATSCSAPDRP